MFLLYKEKPNFMSYSFIGLAERVFLPAEVPSNYFKDRFLTKFEVFLRQKSYIQDVKVADNSLIFRGPMFRFVWNGWNMFNPVSNGQISIYGKSGMFWVEYKIFFWEFFFIAMLFSTIAFFGLFPSFVFRAAYLLIIWSIYIFHTLWVKTRLENYIKLLGARICEEFKDEQTNENFSAQG